MVEIDDGSITYRMKDDPVAGGMGRRHDGKILVTEAVKCAVGGKAGRVRLKLIKD